MSITAVFERIGSRLRQRTTSAQELVETSAKTLAAGGAVDDAAVESALVAAGLNLDAYRQRVDFHVERNKRLQELEKLGPARTRLEDLDKRIAAEGAKHLEIVEGYRKRWVALREQADEAGRIVDGARNARDWILHPDNAPLHLAGEYRAALDAEQAAHVRIGDVERLLREIRERDKSAKGWIEQLEGEDAREIHGPSSAITKAQRSKLSATAEEKIAEHETRRKRYAREIADAEKDLAAARDELARAEAVLVDIRKRILKS